MNIGFYFLGVPPSGNNQPLRRHCAWVEGMGSQSQARWCFLYLGLASQHPWPAGWLSRWAWVQTDRGEALSGILHGTQEASLSEN